MLDALASDQNPFPGWNPGEASDPGWEWRDRGSPGSPEGNWYNPELNQSLHPNLGHAAPLGPHWDWRAPDGQWYRMFPDGRILPT